MGFNAHRGTTGHKIGSSIIGKDLGQSAGKPNGEDTASQSMGFSNIHIKPAENGIVIEHSKMGSPESASESQTHVFQNAQRAHDHLGMLLGIKEGSGSERD